MKFKEFLQVTVCADGDFLLKDGTNGTKIIKASDAAKGFLDSLIDPIAHASIYRGKSLGTSLYNGSLKGDDASLQAALNTFVASLQKD